MALLKGSKPLGAYFQSSENYLDIRAVDYCAKDQAIIIPNRDAQAVVWANENGMHENMIFEEGRIVLIPEPMGRNLAVQ